MNKPNTQVAQSNWKKWTKSDEEAACRKHGITPQNETDIAVTVIGTKVYFDGKLFAKTSSWPNAMLVKKALEFYLPIHLKEGTPL